MIGATAVDRIVMKKTWIAFGRLPLDATISPPKLPSVVGVPEMTPSDEIESPGGNPVAEKVMGAVPTAETV